MYPPNSVPQGPHHVYIFQDQTRPWFKIGESRRPYDRRKEVTWKVHGGNSLDKLKEYRRWTFQNYYAGIHVEQAAMGLLKNLGLSPVRKPDWFEIDCATMDAVILSIDELARSIILWEQRNASIECVCYSGKPYGDYLHDTDFVTLGEVWEKDDGRVEIIEVPLARRLAEKKRHYEYSRRKMPNGLAQLIAAMDDKSNQKIQSFVPPG